MNLRWLLGNFTDPQYKLPRKEQFRLSWVAHEKYLSEAKFWGWTAIIVAPAIIALGLLGRMLDAMGYGGENMAYLIGLGIMLLIFWPWCAWMYRYTYIKPIRRAMREEGFDLCIECGYELRGLPDDVTKCPECGSDRPS